MLQTIVLIAAAVPLLAGGAGMICGPDFLRGIDGAVPIDLDSHMRYLSGLLFGIGIAFLWAVPRIERASSLFGALALIVICGGVARLLGVVAYGLPGGGHIFGLIMELGVVPALALWQRRIARLYRH